MQYCVRYYQGADLSAASELNLENQGNASMEAFVNFCKAHPDQRVNMVLTNSNACKEFFKRGGGKILNSIMEESPNTKIALQLYATHLMPKTWTPTQELLEDLKNLKCPYYFGFVCVDIEDLHYLASLGASEVYIGGELGFKTHMTRRAANQFNLRLRAIPNYIIQAPRLAVPALKQFFVRPEEVRYYEDDIDIFDLYCGNHSPEVILQAYQEQKWYGSVNLIIPNIIPHFDTKHSLPVLHYRAQCGRSCLYGSGCSICDSAVSIASLLEKKEIFIHDAIDIQ